MVSANFAVTTHQPRCLEARTSLGEAWRYESYRVMARGDGEGEMAEVEGHRSRRTMQTSATRNLGLESAAKPCNGTARKTNGLRAEAR